MAEDGFTKDGTTDCRGKPAIRRKQELGKPALSNVVAVNNVANWSGTCYVIPLLGAFLADAYLGRYWTIAAGSRTSVFFLGLYLVALGIGGIKPLVETLSFGDQPHQIEAYPSRFSFFDKAATVTDLSTSHGNPGWIPDNLNHGRLHYFFCLLAVLSVLNLGYLLVARWYTYKKALDLRRYSIVTSCLYAVLDSNGRAAWNELLKLLDYAGTVAAPRPCCCYCSPELEKKAGLAAGELLEVAGNLLEQEERAVVIVAASS
uniref:Uncharacterized protein n=1 Tax=Salix viminalis TaxID=40686 RepID=A0A6N2MQI9_SALVM